MVESWAKIWAVREKITDRLNQLGERFGGSWESSIEAAPKERGLLVIVKIPRASEISFALPAKLIGTPEQIEARLLPIFDSLLK